MFNCQTENETIEINESNLLEKFQNRFNPKDYKNALPYEFDVQWDNLTKNYSEELETHFYEFPIIYTSKFNPDEIHKSKKRNYNLSYKVFITENEEKKHEYYILRSYQKNAKENANNSEEFTGFIHLLNKNGNIIFAKKLEKGIEDSKKFYNDEFKHLRKKDENLQARVEEGCFTITTEHWTDWYINVNGTWSYQKSIYEGSTTQKICYGYWVPDLFKAGGGGAGTYKNTGGDAGVYGNCTGSECKYKIDDAEITNVIEEPETPILNINNYLNCFDTTKPAQLTIYVDQPIANQDDSWTSGAGKAGHAFISITQGNLTRSWGLYPEGNANPFNSNDPHAFGNNSQDEFDVSITFTINHVSLLNIIDDATNYNLNYDLDTNNCTDYVIQAAGLAGITLPDPQSSWPNGGGSNPGAFGQALRTMTLTNGMTRNNTTGTAAQNASPSNCN